MLKDNDDEEEQLIHFTSSTSLSAVRPAAAIFLQWQWTSGHHSDTILVHKLTLCGYPSIHSFIPPIVKVINMFRPLSRGTGRSDGLGSIYTREGERVSPVKQVFMLLIWHWRIISIQSTSSRGRGCPSVNKKEE